MEAGRVKIVVIDLWPLASDLFITKARSRPVRVASVVFAAAGNFRQTCAIVFVSNGPYDA